MTKERLNKHWWKALLIGIMVTLLVNQFSGCLTTRANAVMGSPEKIINVDRKLDSLKKCVEEDIFKLQLEQKNDEERFKNIEESLIRYELKAASIHEVVYETKIEMKENYNKIIGILLTKN
jgi:hypothetical protein